MLEKTKSTTRPSLTKEQRTIIESTGDLKINAVAGSGKTTTVIEYAKARPRNSRILYLAFNKSVKLEAQRRFGAEGLDNVTVETAHSLAYKNVVIGSKYTVAPHGYKTHELVEILGLQGLGEKHAEFIAANHISKFATYFCNSDAQRVSDLNYLDVVSEQKSKAFASVNYAFIERHTRQLLGMMNSGEVAVTHDFYLKKFQLSNPQLRFDFILFDEGQDASPAMLDVFLNQRATKVIVGDTHQQIYGWRFAVNALAKADFKTLNLSTSFRFNDAIAKLAIDVLNWKNQLHDFKPVVVNGAGSLSGARTKAVIARTNLGLLLKAIEHVTNAKYKGSIYFEGNINSYTYADDGASLYDVLHLYNNKRGLIRDKLIGRMKDLDELEEYISKTEDAQLGMMLEIIHEYGNDIPAILKNIKARHVDDKAKAETIFSTVHRCKGMEYDSVHLVSDFITEEKLKKAMADKSVEPNRAKLSEEINLLYVAVTRTQNELHIPETLLPKDFPAYPNIRVIRTKPLENDPVTVESPSKKKNGKDNGVKSKSYTVDAVREKHKSAYQSWTPELDDELRTMLNNGVKPTELAKYFGRTKGAIASRIKKLNLMDDFQDWNDFY